MVVYFETMQDALVGLGAVTGFALACGLAGAVSLGLSARPKARHASSGKLVAARDRRRRQPEQADVAAAPRLAESSRDQS